MSRARRIEGYAIVSDDGMLANAEGVIPPALIVEGDQVFFERGLDAADVVVHGRHSQEEHKRSATHLRLKVTSRVAAIAPDPTNERARLWNPAGASFEQALDALNVTDPIVGIIGATQVFGLFLDRYDVFYLSRAPGVTLPGGRPVFPQVPALTPEQVLSERGYRPGQHQVLDAAKGVSVVSWTKL